MSGARAGAAGRACAQRGGEDAAPRRGLVAGPGDGAARREFLRDVVEGLSAREKRLPCKYFYDARGAKLFEAICELEEYYLTRAEVEIMRSRAGEMAERIGPRAVVIEPGSGAGIKTRLLLEALDDPAAYVPIDISQEQLERTALDLSREFPGLRVWPVHGDFAADGAAELGEAWQGMMRGGEGLRGMAGYAEGRYGVRRRVVYFPGSTIGNFDRAQAVSFLKRLAGIAGPRGALLIGADLKKDVSELEAAYNDARRITAEFNLNLLLRVNRELGGDFDLDAFEHRAVYVEEQGRVEMRLVSRRAQRVRVAGREFVLGRGEWIHTESSHKYGPEEFEEMLGRSGWKARARWVDSGERFSVVLGER